MKSLADHDVINMQYTSGTTGFPKGVMLTHHNVVNNGRMVGDVMGMTEKDSLLIPVPLFHCFGCVMSTMNCVYHGSTMVVLEFFDPAKALQSIAAERCTAVNGVPTMFVAMLNHPDFNLYDLQSLRTGIMAGAPCPEETMNQVRTKMYCEEIVIAFGQTESAPVMTMTRRDDPVELRVATVGRLLPDIEGKIVDPTGGIPPSARAAMARTNWPPHWQPAGGAARTAGAAVGALFAAAGPAIVERGQLAPAGGRFDAVLEGPPALLGSPSMGGSSGRPVPAMREVGGAAPPTG